MNCDLCASRIHSNPPHRNPVAARVSRTLASPAWPLMPRSQLVAPWFLKGEISPDKDSITTGGHELKRIANQTYRSTDVDFDILLYTYRHVDYDLHLNVYQFKGNLDEPFLVSSATVCLSSGVSLRRVISRRTCRVSDHSS